MDKRLKMIALLLLLSLFVAGCNGAREIDEYAYIMTIGLDTAPNNQYVITYRIATGRGQSNKSGESQETSIIYSFISPSRLEAESRLNAVTAQTPNLTHLKVIVVGEEFAKQGVGDILSSMLRYQELRDSVFIIVARGTAKELMEKNKPKTEKLPSRWLEMIMASNDETGYFLRSNIHSFFVRLKTTGGAPYASYAALNPLDLEPKPAGEREAGSRTAPYYAGNVGRSGGNQTEILGTAVFAGDKMVGILSNEESRAVAIMTGEFRNGYITLDDPLIPKTRMDVNLRRDRKPSIKPSIVDGIVTFDVKVLLDADILTIPSGINYESTDYIDLLEQQLVNIITNQLEKTLTRTQQLGTDVVGFGLYTRTLFSNYDDYDQFNWYEVYPTAKFNLDVTVNIRRTGLMHKTSPFKRADSK
ncbi:MAG: Ger(x)C family spore germination protein [Sporomusa sp.]